MHYIKTAALLTALVAAGGCTGISTRMVKTNDPEPHGIRVYPPCVYLFVSTNESRLVTLPDMGRAYDVKPWAILAKHDFSLELSEGMITKLAADQDSTASLALLQKMAELGAAAAAGAKGVEGTAFATDFGLTTGIYRIDDKGVFQLVNQKP
jgi:hypothetical protein